MFIRLLKDKPQFPNEIPSSSVGPNPSSQVGFREICAISSPLPSTSVPRSGKGSRGGRTAAVSKRGKGKVSLNSAKKQPNTVQNTSRKRNSKVTKAVTNSDVSMTVV